MEHYELYFDGEFVCSCDSGELSQTLHELSVSLSNKAVNSHNLKGLYNICFLLPCDPPIAFIFIISRFLHMYPALSHVPSDPLSSRAVYIFIIAVSTRIRNIRGYFLVTGTYSLPKKS